MQCKEAADIVAFPYLFLCELRAVLMSFEAGENRFIRKTDVKKEMESSSKRSRKNLEISTGVLSPEPLVGTVAH